MKNFIQKNFVPIVLVLTVLTFFKSCSDSKALRDMQKELKQVKDSLVTKNQLSKELKINGLEAEKRMIQATDRKILDVQRQTQIEEEIKLLRNEK